jgi:hypothetical protein
MEEWRNFEVDNTFCMRLYKAASQIIGIENLGNLAFYCKLLMEFGDKDLSEKLQNNINNWLSEEYDSKGYLFSNEQFSFDFNEDNQFYSYLT